MKLMNEICISIEYTSSKKKKNVVSNLEMGFSYLKTYFEYNFKNKNGLTIPKIELEKIFIIVFSFF